jgi:hypothetical protein
MLEIGKDEQFMRVYDGDKDSRVNPQDRFTPQIIRRYQDHAVPAAPLAPLRPRFPRTTREGREHYLTTIDLIDVVVWRKKDGNLVWAHVQARWLPESKIDACHKKAHPPPIGFFRLGGLCVKRFTQTRLARSSSCSSINNDHPSAIRSLQCRTYSPSRLSK